MKKRMVYPKGKRVRLRTRHRRKMGSIILILFLAIPLIGLSRGTWPRVTPQSSAVTDNLPLISVDYAPAKKQQNTAPAETDNPWYLTLVNRWNPIPENYEVNLVEVAGGEQVDARIYEPLMEMLEAAKEANWDQLPVVVSGYRTQEEQQRLYDEKITQYGRQGYAESEARKLAEQWVALPGYSEHQLGFAVDINGATYDVYLWLQENSYQYGFIFRYPGNKTEITGTAEEVWHYRYVGVEAATKIYEQGICLEEYLEIMQSVY